MSQRETIAFLQEMKTSAETYLKTLNDCVSDLREIEDIDQAAGVTREVRNALPAGHCIACQNGWQEEKQKHDM